MLRERVKVADIVPAHPDEIEIRVCCECGEKYGDYLFTGDASIKNDGTRIAVNPHPTKRVLRGAKRRNGLAGGRARYDAAIAHAEAAVLSWPRCRTCGATPQRRTDTFGELEVVYIRGRPTIYIS